MDSSNIALQNSLEVKTLWGGCMSDDLKKSGAQDRSRINVNEPWEVKHWTKELDVTEEQLRELVRQHGVSANKVRLALAQNKNKV
jgi:hypothetical protein